MSSLARNGEMSLLETRTLRSFATGAVVALVGPPLLSLLWRGVFDFLARHRARRKHPEIRSRKKALLKDRLEMLERYVSSVPDNPISSGEVDLITSRSIRSLRNAIASKELSCRKVVKSFIANALCAHAATNCLVDVLTPAEIEEQISQVDRVIGAGIELSERLLLLGLPCSVKDNISLRGYDCTLGLHDRCFDPAEADSAVVNRIRAHGGIIFCKTNIPVLLLSYESDSGLFGPCSNPHQHRHSAGGSSGGEAALVAMKGAAAGVGSDIGGSIRGPAAFCGVAALKPSMFRVANLGTLSVLPAQEGVGATIGPICRSVSDVTIMTRVLLPPQPSSHGDLQDQAQLTPLVADGLVNNVPFRIDLHKLGLAQPRVRFGFYFDDGFVKSAPACARAVMEAVVALRELGGHECVPISVAEFSSPALALFYQVLSADGTKTILRGLGHEQPVGPVFHALQFATKSPLTKYIFGHVVELRLRSRFFGGMLRSMTERSVAQYFSLMSQRNTLRHEFAKMMATAGVGAIVCPGMMVPAVKLGGSADISFAITYTMLFNVLDMPAVSVPVTAVDPELDEWREDYYPANGRERSLHDIVRAGYDAAAMKGLPVGVQVCTPRFTEELALAYAERLERCLAMRHELQQQEQPR